MDSKEFEFFINNDDDTDILECQYLIISQRIHRSSTCKLKNIAVGKNLFPDTITLAAIDDHQMKKLYFQQLEYNRDFIEKIIRLSLEKELDIIFLTTKKEEKYLKFLDMIQEYILEEYGYPIYRYSYFASGGKLLKYNKRKILKKLDQGDKNNLYRDIERLSLQSDDVVEKELKRRSKEDLKKMLKCIDKDEVKKGMKKSDLIDSLMMLI